MTYLLHLIVFFEIYAIVALSLNLVVGYCGMLTIAHAAYFAIGAYTYSLLTLNLGWGFVPATVAAASVGAIFSLAVSLPAWRLRGDFFFMGSLAVQSLFFSLFNNWSDPEYPLGTWGNLTNGPSGITGIPKTEVLGIAIGGPTSYVMLASIVTLGCGLLIRRLKSSPWGRLLLVMREDELATRGIAKNTRLLKVQAFAFSCAFAAVAGALYAGYVRYVDPSSASLDESILMLSMVIVGGIGNFRGPIVGAAVLVGLPEILRLFQLDSAQTANLRLMIYGGMLIVLMHFRPQGIAGVYRIK